MTTQAVATNQLAAPGFGNFRSLVQSLRSSSVASGDVPVIRSPTVSYAIYLLPKLMPWLVSSRTVTIGSTLPEISCSHFVSSRGYFCRSWIEFPMVELVRPSSGRGPLLAQVTQSAVNATGSSGQILIKKPTAKVALQHCGFISDYTSWKRFH